MRLALVFVALCSTAAFAMPRKPSAPKPTRLPDIQQQAPRTLSPDGPSSPPMDMPIRERAPQPRRFSPDGPSDVPASRPRRNLGTDGMGAAPIEIREQRPRQVSR